MPCYSNLNSILTPIITNSCTLLYEDSSLAAASTEKARSSAVA